MKIKTELSEMPPVFTVAKIGEMVDVTFYSEIQSLGRGDETIYEATAWTARFPWTPSLETRIAGNVDAWRARVEAICTENAAAEARAKRNALLQNSDAEVALDRLGLSIPSGGGSIFAWLEFLQKLGSALTGAWSQYRQALRDLPEQPGFPFEIDWPVPPGTGEEVQA